MKTTLTSHHRGLVLSLAAAAMLILGSTAAASDHDDTPLLKTIPRHDLRITDLHVFLRGENLVLSVCLDPTVPATATGYVFASDLTVRIHLDNVSQVRFDDPDDLATYGGTIVDPAHIRPGVTFEATFDASGRAQWRARGIPRPAQSRVRFFAGLRDDPFIRGPRIGRNIAALVVEVPMALVTQGQNRPILVWTTSQVDDIIGPFQELGGRSLRSQFVENDPLNTRAPSEHFTKLGVTPDVVIYDPSRAAAFPNGRELADDVVDLVGDPRILTTDAPFPTANDVPFLTEFPYLAPPHAPPP